MEVPCTTLSADWAAQRIRNLSLVRAVLNGLGLKTGRQVASLIDSFHYPRLGPGQMYEDMCRRLSREGGDIRTGQEVMEIQHDQERITGVLSRDGDGEQPTAWPHCLSSMPISDLVKRMSPRPPEAVMQAARALRYRSIITVNLLFKTKTTLPDNWIYLHSPEVTAGRLQLYAN